MLTKCANVTAERRIAGGPVTERHEYKHLPGQFYTTRHFPVVAIETVEGLVEVTVDVEKALAFLGPRALLSKGGKAVRGYCTVKVLSREVTKRTEVPRDE